MPNGCYHCAQGIGGSLVRNREEEPVSARRESVFHRNHLIRQSNRAKQEEAVKVALSNYPGPQLASYLVRGPSLS